MKKIFAISRYTFKENIRNKIFYVLVFFALLMFSSAVLFSILGGEQEVRLLLDFGLAAIELFALLLTVFASVSLILEEIENKTIYLVLTRPLSRIEYLLGRYLGILLAVFLSITVMSIGHLALLFLKGWSLKLEYFLVIFGLGFKVMLVSGIAIFFSLFSTSAISSLSFTFFFWLLGHFVEELKFIGSKLNHFWQYPAKIFFYLIPNFQYFNFRDRISLETSTFLRGENLTFIFLAVFYSAVYLTACFSLSNLFFLRKEF